MKKFLKILTIFAVTIAVWYTIILGLIYFQYNFWENFQNRKPLPENEITENFITKNITENDILQKIPSDKNIFTQGIFVENGEIFMSSGNPSNFPNTKTIFGKLIENGDFETKIQIEDEKFFGEGATKFDGKIFWTFWKNGKIFIFDEKNFEKIDEIDIPGEGWGLTTDGKSLILSDGSEFLTFFDKNLQISKKIAVTDKDEKITRLNELEFVNGKILANIWLTNDIVIIEPKTGEVVTRKNFDFLKNIELTENPTAQEMNGIAYDGENVILTGKMWENLYIFDKKFFEK